MAERNCVERLAARVRTDGARPLLTYYGAAGRTELSAKTFANWADKTANLLADLGVGQGDRIAAPLLTTHPGHWLGLALTMGAWQAGVGVVAADDPETALAVVGPEAPYPRAGVSTLVASLHPLGLANVGLGSGLADFTTEVLAMPDAHWAEPLAADQVWWVDQIGGLTGAELAAVPAASGRMLVVATGARQAVLAGLVEPLAGGGSVVVAGPDVPADYLETIARQEGVSE